MAQLIKCSNCNGHYVIREGKYGTFAGCSEYPHCKSTRKIYELAHMFISKYGMNLYGWQKTCWKCKQDTMVYSYFLYYELKEIDNIFSSVHGIGIGDIPCIDKIISNKYPTVEMRYSSTTQSKYMANICMHCKSLQGRNYVVDDPHEIMTDLFHDHTMEKYLVENIKLTEIAENNLLAELKACIDL